MVTAHTPLPRGVRSFASLAPALLSFAPHTPTQPGRETAAQSDSRGHEPEAQGGRGLGESHSAATLVPSQPVPSVVPGGQINQEKVKRDVLRGRGPERCLGQPPPL